MKWNKFTFKNTFFYVNIRVYLGAIIWMQWGITALEVVAYILRLLSLPLVMKWVDQLSVWAHIEEIDENPCRNMKDKSKYENWETERESIKTHVEPNNY